MPDIKEKLVELLRGIQYLGGLEEKIADHLIANGVTIQQWISVEERLPTEEEDEQHRIVGVVNGYNGKIKFTDAEIFVRYCHKENTWWSDDYDIEGCTVKRFFVVPQPPKGE